jgi:cyanophycin synthetase
MLDVVPEGVDVILFTMDDANCHALRHLSNGGRAVLLRGSAIVMAEGERRTPLVDAQRLAFTLSGLARHNVANALACTAAAWGAGVAREHICEGLTTFRTTATENPLRLNLYRARGTTVLVDYAHNPAAYRAMVTTGRQLTSGRLIGLVAAPGDRRDEELREVGRACATGFDHLVVYEMDDRRGRAPGETARLIASGVQEIGVQDGGLPRDRVQIIPTLSEALHRGLAMCGPNDLLLYGCASYLSDLTNAIPEGVEELVVMERRHAHLAQYADGHSVDGAKRGRGSPDWDPTRPERRRSPVRPYIVPQARQA